MTKSKIGKVSIGSRKEKVKAQQAQAQQQWSKISGVVFTSHAGMQ